MEKNQLPERIHETKTKIDLWIVISQLLSLSTEPNFLFKERNKTCKKKDVFNTNFGWKFWKFSFLEEKP
jgi:hypothetical protein